jgi:hypothetical protein
MFLVDALGVSGRVRHITLTSRLGYLSGHAYVHGYRLDIPAGRGLAEELDFVMKQAPGVVAGSAGEFDEGRPWIAVLQYWPFDDERAANVALQLALGLVDGYRIVETFRYDISSLRWYYFEEGEAAGIPEDVLTELIPTAPDYEVSFEVSGLVVELTGYPAARMAQNYSKACAFPGEEHDCARDIFADIMQSWTESRVG